MNLNYSDEQAMLRDSARRFLADTHSLEQRHKRANNPAAIDKALWASFAELGWLGLPISEQAGGHGGGAVELAIVAEELGRANVIEPFVAIVVLAGGLIEALGTPDQHTALLRPLIEGAAIPVLAHLENGAQSRLDHVGTKARRSRSSYTLSGEKVLVRAAGSADTILVTARVEGEDGIALFAVSATAPGLTLDSFRTVDDSEAADIRLDDIEVPVEARLGDGDVLPTLERMHDRAIAALCADAVGVMDVLLETTVEYTKQRVQFGKPLASFQALQHRMAEMAVKCQEARASALLAALSVDASPVLRIRGVSGAKAKIGKVSRHVAQEAIQLHGAIGFSEEMPIGAWFRRLYAFENSFGSTADHLARYASVITLPEVLDNGLLRARRFA